MQNTKDTSDPTTTMNMALDRIAKALMLNKTIPTTNNQRSSPNPSITQIAQPVHNVQKMNGISVDTRIANQYVNGNGVIAPAEGNGIQSTQEEFEFMTAVDAHEEIERVKVNCTLEDTLKQASTSRTQSDNAPIYDSDGSVEQCLVTANHDVSVLSYVNDMNSRVDNQSANVSICENQKKHKANAKKSKELRSKGSLASSWPSKPRNYLRLSRLRKQHTSIYLIVVL
nr:hypothetical protein [Tanacetum cinerariifolium]